jgi:hypothetical protein
LILTRVEGWRRDTLMCKVKGYGLGGRGSIPDRGKYFFYIEFRPTLRSTQPPRSISPGGKRPGCEAESSPLSSAEVKNGLGTHMFSWRSA